MNKSNPVFSIPCRGSYVCELENPNKNTCKSFNNLQLHYSHYLLIFEIPDIF